MGEKRLVDVVRLDLAPEVPRARREERDVHGGSVPLVIVTHEASEAAMQRALSVFNALDAVQGAVKLIRMEEF